MKFRFKPKSKKLVFGKKKKLVVIDEDEDEEENFEQEPGIRRRSHSGSTGGRWMIYNLADVGEWIQFRHKQTKKRKKEEEDV